MKPIIDWKQVVVMYDNGYNTERTAASIGVGTVPFLKAMNEKVLSDDEDSFTSRLLIKLSVERLGMVE